MCGISGVFSTGAPLPESIREGLDTVARRMQHRGPDALGEWACDQLVLAHNRLAIIDLESGSQPMVDPATGNVIVFNGEIYNYLELRDQLLAAGLTFTTNSDTEVILKGYARFGVDVLSHLNGMFAFALYDPRRGELFMARDRFGEKPLHYFVTGDRVYFASELLALREFRDCPGSLSEEGLLEYFGFGNVSAPRTILADVHQLAPGHAMVVGKEGLRTFRYYRRSPGPSISGIDDAQIGETLTRAISMRLRADVPVAALLSGGIDSSLIAVLAQRASSSPLQTFAFGWAGEDDELPFARVVAERAGTHHHEIVLDRTAFAADLPGIVRAMDGPQSDSAAVVVYGLCREIAGNGIKVVLSGEGGDELFGGYPWYLGAGGARSLAKRMIRGKKQDLHDYIEGKLNFPAKELAGPFGSHHVAAMLEQRGATLGGRGATLEGRIDLDYSFFIPSVLMPKVDRMSMAHSVEVRAPFLDHELVELWGRLRGPEKVKGDELKARIRGYCARAGILPPELLNRKKMGMNLPLSWWVRSNEQMFREVVQDGASTSVGLFGAEQVSGWFVELARDSSGGWSRAAQQIWSAFILEIWYREAFRGPPSRLLAGEAA